MFYKESFACFAFFMPLLIFACSSKKTSEANVASSSEQMKQKSQNYERTAICKDANVDSLRHLPTFTKSNNEKSGVDISVNPYYDEGYDNGMEDGYNDGRENVRGDSYDDSSNYRGSKRNEYELGYEEGYEAGFDDGFADSSYDSEEEE